MSWSDPEIIKQLETAPLPESQENEAFARAMEQVERMAESLDPCDMMEGRLVQVCLPILQEWGDRLVVKHDTEFAAPAAIGVCRAFAIALANVLAVVPESIAPSLKQYFDEQLAANVTFIRDHLASKEGEAMTRKAKQT